MVCGAIDPYGTFDYKAETSSKMRCWPRGQCPDECDSPDRTASGLFNSTHFIDFPGETSCTRRSTGITSCLSSVPACVFSEYSLVPLPPYTEVRLLTSCVHEPVYQMNFYDQNMNTISSQNFSVQGSFSSNDDIALELLSSYSELVDSGLPTHVITRGGLSYLDNASFKGSPQVGMIGDVQSEDQSSAESGDFIYDPRVLIRKDAKKDFDVFVFSQPGIQRLEKLKSLPAAFGRNIVYPQLDSVGQVSSVSYLDTSPSKSLVSISMFKPYTFIRNVQKVCPNVISSNITGCYSCQYGSTLNIQLKSDCLDGSSFFQSEHCAKTMFYVSRDVTEVSFTCYFDEPTVSETFRLDNLTFTAKGELSPALVLSQEQLIYSGNKTKNSNGSKGFINGSWTWWEYTIFAGAGLLIVVLFLFFVLPVLIYLFPYAISLIRLIFSLFRRTHEQSLPHKEKDIKPEVVPKTENKASFRIVRRNY